MALTRHRDAPERGTTEASRPNPMPRREPTPRRRPLTLGQRLRRDWQMLLMMLPGVVALLLFFYIPILGNVIAFKDYQPFIGIYDSEWVGLQQFIDLYDNDAFWLALKNTFVFAAFQLVLLFPVPIALAILVDSLISARVRRVFQSIVYLPHFLSWVLVIALFQQMLGGAGFINNTLRDLGIDPIPFMTNPDTFPWLITAQLIWKESGWAMIIFLAALAAIDTSLYESAAVDGAGRWRRVWHITLPGLRPVIVLLLILRIGDILSVGFEQFLLQRDSVGADAAQVLDTFTYYEGVLGGEWSAGTAAGLAKGIVGIILIAAANHLAHRFGEAGVYQRSDRS
ncbi:sugar ABC transporter permease [Micrococcales bacterium 31B]|nr:sugar ABC transporter permease [Micrococcales bacterium 31B]